MPVDTEQEPAGAKETAAIKEAMSSWMTTLSTELPNPSLGGANEPPAEPNPPAPDPAKAAVVEPETKPEPASPAPSKEPPTTTTTEAPTDERWPRSAKEWKNFTTLRKAKDTEYEKTIATANAKIKELEAKTSAAPTLPPEAQKELETLKKENGEYSKQLRLLAVTNHPKFKQYFEGKVNNTLAQLKHCVGADQLEAVTKLVQAPDSEAKEAGIDKLLEDMSTLQRSRFLGVINGLNSIETERETEINRASQDYDQMVAHAKVEREQRQAGFTKLLDDTVKGMQDAKAGRPEYQLRDGATEWNESVAKRIEAGRKLITGNLPPEVMFKAAFDAAAYPDVLMGYRAALGEVEKLKKQIAEMTARNPRVESPRRTETNGNPPATVLPKNARPMDYTKDFVKKFGDAMRGESP